MEATTPPTASPAPAPAEDTDGFTAVKVFSATMAEERNLLGERITAWLGANAALTPVERIVTQTSDRGYHCLSITLFLAGDPTNYLAAGLTLPTLSPAGA